MTKIPYAPGDGYREGEQKSESAHYLFDRGNRAGATEQIREIRQGSPLFLRNLFELMYLTETDAPHDSVETLVIRGLELDRLDISTALGRIQERSLLPRLKQIYLESCRGELPSSILRRFVLESDGMYTSLDVMAARR
jgi:hypothetical protein